MKKNLTKILLIMAVITVCIGAKVYADYIMNASEVEYTKSDSTKVSVKTALDDLYTKSQKLSEIENLGIDDLNSLIFSQTGIGLTYNESKTITITNPNNLEITVESSDVSIVTVTKNSNTEITISALSKQGSAVINVKATVDEVAFNVKKIGVGVWNGSGTMSVATAKAIITSENISGFQGTEVSYNPSGGGTWRIFYCDEKGKYGDGVGAIYIKRDYNNLAVADSSYRTYYTDANSTTKVAILADLKKFNPQWTTGDGSVDVDNENVVSYLCYHGAWDTYLDSSVAKYAIGSPSTEMYIDAWNQYMGRKQLDYKWVASGTTLAYGSSGANTTCSANGYVLAPTYLTCNITSFGTMVTNYSLTEDANSIFMKLGINWWLASPSCYGASHICIVDRCKL